MEMSGLNGRLRKLEDEFACGDDNRPDLAERLRLALEEARERRRLGLPRLVPQWKGTDHPLAARLRAAHARAEALRKQLRS
jgi:hypothetical protein